MTNKTKLKQLKTQKTMKFYTAGTQKTEKKWLLLKKFKEDQKQRPDLLEKYEKLYKL